MRVADHGERRRDRPHDRRHVAPLDGVELLEVDALVVVGAAEDAHDRPAWVAGVRRDDDRRAAVGELHGGPRREDAERAHERLHRRPPEVDVLERDGVRERLVGRVRLAPQQRAPALDVVGECDHAHDRVRRRRRLEGRVALAVDAAVVLERHGDPERGAPGGEECARSHVRVVPERGAAVRVEQGLGDPADGRRHEEMPDVVHERGSGRLDARLLGHPLGERHRRRHHRHVDGVRGVAGGAVDVAALLEDVRPPIARAEDLGRDRADRLAVGERLGRDRARQLAEHRVHARHEVHRVAAAAPDLALLALLGEAEAHVHEVRAGLLVRAPRLGLRCRERPSHDRALRDGEPALDDDALDLVPDHRVGEDADAIAEIGHRPLAHDELAVDEREHELRHPREEAGEQPRRQLVGAGDRRVPLGVVRPHRDEVVESVQHLDDVGPLAALRSGLRHPETPAARSHALRTRRTEDASPRAKRSPADGAGERRSAAAA